MSTFSEYIKTKASLYPFSLTLCAQNCLIFSQVCTNRKNLPHKRFTTLWVLGIQVVFKLVPPLGVMIRPIWPLAQLVTPKELRGRGPHPRQLCPTWNQQIRVLHQHQSLPISSSDLVTSKQKGPGAKKSTSPPEPSFSLPAPLLPSSSQAPPHATGPGRTCPSTPFSQTACAQPSTQSRRLSPLNCCRCPRLISPPPPSTASTQFPGIPTRLWGWRLNLSANNSARITRTMQKDPHQSCCTCSASCINMAATHAYQASSVPSLLHWSWALPEPGPASHTHGLSRFSCKATPWGLLPDNDSRWPATVLGLLALWATSYSLLSGFLFPQHSQNLARCLLLKKQWSLWYLEARTFTLAYPDISWAHLPCHCLCLFFLTQKVILSSALPSSLMNSKLFNQNRKKKI